MANDIPFIVGNVDVFRSSTKLRSSTGALDLDSSTFPSPRRNSDSIVRSRLPPSPFRILALRLSSLNPISLNRANFASMLSDPPPPTLAPKIRDCLLILIGEGGPPLPLGIWGDCGGKLLVLRERGRADDALRRPNPNLLPGFGGNGGGWSSELRVLPVLLRIAGQV